MAEEILSNEQKQIINASKIDSGGNFLKGGVTSVFAGTVKTAQAGANVVGNTIAATGLVSDITASFIQNLQSKLMSYVSKATVDLTKMPTETIAYWTNETIKANKIDTKEIIKKLTMGADEYAAEVRKKMEDEENQKITENATEKVKEISEKVSYVLNTATEKVNSIAAYISKGPEWIEKQLNKCSYTILTQTEKGIGSTVEAFNESKETWAEGFGKSMGNKIVAPLNKKTERAQKKILEKIEERKNLLKTESSASVAQAIMKLKGILGG